jgi:hypothetical protein
MVKTIPKSARYAVIIILFAIALFAFLLFLYRCICAWGYTPLEDHNNNDNINNGDRETDTDNRAQQDTNGGGDIEVGVIRNPIFDLADDNDDEDGDAAAYRGHGHSNRISNNDRSAQSQSRSPQLTLERLHPQQQQWEARGDERPEDDMSDSASVFTANDNDELAETVNVERIERAGWLLKKATSLKKNWQKRWFFVLDGKLYYVHKPALLVGKRDVRAICVGT